MVKSKKTYDPLTGKLTVDGKEQKVPEINIGQTFERLSVAIGYALENDVQRGQLTERVRTALLRVHSHLEEVCNTIASQIHTAENNRVSRRRMDTLESLEKFAVRIYKTVSDKIGPVSVATEDFHSHIISCIPPDMETYDATEYIDLPFNVSKECPDVAWCEGLLKELQELDKRVFRVLEKSLPHMHRGRLIIGKSIREFLLNRANDRGLSELARNAKLNRVTLYKWMGMDAETMELEMDRFEYAYPKYIIALADATGHKVKVVEGVAEIVPDPEDSQDRQVDMPVELESEVKWMLKSSPTLSKLYKDDFPEFMRVVSGTSKLGSAKDIWLNDNFNKPVAAEKAGLIDEIKIRKQKEDATDVGLINTFIFDEIADVNSDPIDAAEKANLFYTNPVPGIYSREDLFAVKLDTSRFYMDRRFHLPYGATVTLSKTLKPSGRDYVLFSLKEAEGTNHTGWRFGVYKPIGLDGSKVVIDTIGEVVEGHPMYSEEEVSYDKCRLSFNNGQLVSDSRYKNSEEFENEWGTLPVLGRVFAVVDVRL